MGKPQQEIAQPVKRRKYKPHKDLTEDQWAQLRVLYEFNKVPRESLARIWEVSEKTIDRRAKREGWIERRVATAVQTSIEKSTIEMFADAGLPKADLVGLLATDAKEVKTLKNVKVAALDKNGKPLFDKDGLPIMIDKTVEVRDNDVTLRTRQEVNKMCGNLAPVKEEINIRSTVMTIAISLKAVILKVLEYVPDDKQAEIIAEFEKALQEPKQGDAP